MIRFTVVIIEDEPPIARYIKAILEQMGKFHVISMCEDGFDGIKAVEREHIDVLVTDIQMPGMTGLEVIKKAKEIDSQIIPIIVSGYKVFEYAQEAIKLEVFEYLIKPLNKEKIQQVFESVVEKLLQRHQENANLLLEQQLMIGRLDDKFKEQYFTFQYFEAIMIWYKNITEKVELVENIKKNVNGFCDGNNKNIYAVDYKNNLFILIGINSYKKSAVYIKPVTENLMKKNRENNFSFCGVITSIEYPVEEIAVTVKKMYQLLYLHINYESSCFFKLEDNYEAETESNEELLIEQKLFRHLSARIWNLFKEDYIDLFTLWERQQNTQNYIYNKIVTIIKKIGQLERLDKNITAIQDELLDSIQCSNTYGEAMSAIWETFSDIVYKSEFNSKKINKRSMENLYNSIIQYLQENIEKNLFLNEVCDIFGVSQPYVSKLFKRYAGCSYKEYVLKIKMETAIEMMKKTPDLLIKDIAQRLGFENPLYFSTIFKNVMGVSPTQFMHEK